MDDLRKPTRDRQIDVMVNAEKRVAGYLRKWIADLDFRAALHRHDRSHRKDGGTVRRAAGC